MNSDFIYDIGCNNGDDTDFYLRKGFRTLAIDADPMLCEQVALRFKKDVDQGRLQVVNGLIADKDSESAPFYIFDECSGWSTADPEFRRRHELAGRVSRKIEVPVISMSTLLQKYGVPYYMKIDIEGFDHIALQGLFSFLKHTPDRPNYVSVEFSREDLGIALEQLLALIRCGYTRFNFVNQGMRSHVKAPLTPREGKYAEFFHMQITTGLFGKELDGKWLDVYAATERIVEICRVNKLFREDPRYSKNGQFSGTLRAKIYNRFRRYAFRDPVNGLELHAAL